MISIKSIPAGLLTSIALFTPLASAEAPTRGVQIAPERADQPRTSRTAGAGEIAAGAADLILFDGFIYTVDSNQPTASAIAVRNGAIIFVGADAGALALNGPQTRVIDLNGKMAMPGVHDSHVHILEAFQQAAGTCSLPTGIPIADYIPIIQACAPNQVGTNWVLGYGQSIFDLQMFMEAGGVPKDILDQAVPDRPAAFLEETSHSVWANSMALAAAGFTAATPDPPGGAILRDPTTGEPNGLLLDSAGEILFDLALTPNPVLDELNYDALLTGLAFANRNGITSLCDARAYWRRGYLKAWRRARDSGTLSVRAIVGLWAYPYIQDDAAQIASLISMYSNDPASRLRFSQVKLYSDGEISHTTAAMLQPYMVDPAFFQGPLVGPLGLNYFDQTRLTNYITQLQAVGFDMHIHTIGDRGVREALNAIEATQALPGGASARHRLTHVTLTSPQDVTRFAQLGVTADFQMSDASAFPNVFDFYFGIYLPPAVLAQEPHRLRTIYDTGARVVLSSDYDVGSISPFLGMHHALTRGAESLPTLDAAIRAYTIEPAYLMRQENTVGSLEVGKRADIIVLDRNLFNVPVSQIPATHVLLTLLDGAEVWRDPSFTVVADLNGDGVVNGADLAILLTNWGPAGGASDLDGDGDTDGADLATLLANWTT